MTLASDYPTFTDFEWAQIHYSDAYKDAFGFRPRNNLFNTVEEIDTALAELQTLITAGEIAKSNRQAHNYNTWKAYIESLMVNYSISKATAIRWDMVAEDCDLDEEYYCFLIDINYKWAEEIRSILKE